MSGTLRTAILVVSLCCAARPVAAQDAVTGATARSSVGQVGQRQTRDQVEVQPLGRINTRIQNRIQSRVRNRIDRFYNPSADAISPFAAADQEARTAGKPK